MQFKRPNLQHVIDMPNGYHPSMNGNSGFPSATNTNEAQQSYPSAYPANVNVDVQHSALQQQFIGAMQNQV